MARKEWGGLLVILATALAVRVLVLFYSAQQDDAYITYRYVENIAAGQGFVYNLGQRVLGTTTPFFTLLLVPFVLLHIKPEIASIAIAFAADLSICMLLYFWLRRNCGTLAGTLAALFHATNYAAVTAAAYGMEVQVFMLLTMSAFYFASTGRLTRAAIASSCAILTRPEGLLLLGLAVAYWLISARKAIVISVRTTVVPFATILLAWLLFATLYFGSPIPNSLTAKAKYAGFEYGEWLHFFFTRNPLILALWGGFLVGGLLASRCRGPSLMLLTLWTLGYAGFYLVGQPTFLAPWYFPPAVVGITTLTAVMTAWIAQRVLRQHWRFVLPIIGWLLISAAVFPRSLDSAQWWRLSVETVYRPLGTWMAENTDPRAVVFAGDIGYLGYLSQRRILDAAALVSPEVLDFYEAHPGERNRDIDLVLETRPDLVVLRMIDGRYTKWTGSAFVSTYEPVRRFQLFGETHLYPETDPSSAYRSYESQRRSIPDYIVYRRR